MALAQRLNDLALANSGGLLNDDEYRLLRQNLFEEYSSNVVIPVEAPVVPIAAHLDVHVRTRPSTSSATPPLSNHQRTASKHSYDSRKTFASTPSRQKSSVTSGVASLIRKATGRRTPIHVHEPPITPSKEPHKLDITDHETPHKFMVILPKLLHRKPSTMRRDPPKPLSDTWTSSRSTTTSSSASHNSHSISLLTPTHGYPHSVNLSTSSLGLSNSQSNQPLPIPRDVFDDANLDTAKDIRSTIMVTEDELHTLAEAFNNLEVNALRRLQKQNARRLPANTPASVDVVLTGREWREHRLIPSPSSSLFGPDAPRRKGRTLASIDTTGSDGVSIRSGSSQTTSISQSRSISSLPRHMPTSASSGSSPLSASFRNGPSASVRSNSISSSSSYGAASFTSGGMLAPAPTHTHTHSVISRLSRSASHLSLRPNRNIGSRSQTPSSLSSASQETVFRTVQDDSGSGVGDDEFGDDPELQDIRRRREELVARYTARLDYLRAKLKGAELHEKLLRK